MDYKKTLNLPKTKFPMRAGLLQKEPQIQKRWEEMRLYERVRTARKGAPRFILHDGPPYATGDLHIGTVMNKVLKDIVVRYQTMRGKDCPFVPGWDCHGLPIEHQVMRKLGKEFRKKSPAEIRQLCKEYASKYVDYQRKQFKRFGVLADWKHPYLTMSPDFEAGIMDVLLKIVEQGYVYRELRAIHWCPDCETALAEAELEYKTIGGPSIYVKFKGEEDFAHAFGLNLNTPVYVLIWTTTPWTLPANVAVALGAGYEYAAVQVGDEILVMATETIERVMKDAGVEKWKILAKKRGEELEGLIYEHPFMEHKGRLILADFVTLEQGTGTVHIAPGHGKEDYDIGRVYGLPIISPVDGQGRFTDEVKRYAGMRVFDADKKIIEDLREIGALFAATTITHSYPHCWRCKGPLIFRATKQWFINVDHHDLRRRLLEQIKQVKWIPAWGRIRITSMVRERPDWCISRQRFWGVPIPAVYCEECGTALLEPEVVRRARDIFAEYGAGAWFTQPLETFLPPGLRCPKCGSQKFCKENDIVDVWFESGSSYCPVLMRREPPLFPADIYLEGTDQHRGWFQTSLITCVAAFGRAPYRCVLTHGFVVDEQGRKMSKSLGNFISVDEVLQHFGADIVRLWISSIDYKDEIPTSLNTIESAVDDYRKIRNTFRFLLANLYDFEPQKDALSFADLRELDRWALARLHSLLQAVYAEFAEYQFHRVFRRLLQFCVNDMSTFYFDVLKDVLYCDEASSPRRRSAQTALWHILNALVRVFAPILVHTCEEVWDHANITDKEESVHLALMPDVDEELLDAALIERYERFFKVRKEVQRQIEELRKEQKIGSNLEVEVRLFAEEEHLARFLSSFGEEFLSELLIVSGVEFAESRDGLSAAREIHGLYLEALPSKNPKCERCWRQRLDVGNHPQFPKLCKRCASVVASVSAS